MPDMKILIIDDNAQRRDEIKECMPNYASTVCCGYGSVAINQLKPDKEGNVPNIVIMNADDSKGMGLYTFDWMRTKSNDPQIMDIPVILLTKDEFSDRCLEFLEIDDVEFYEGDLDSDAIFSKLMETIKKEDFAEEKEQTSYSSIKSFNRISGVSLKPQGETKDNKRSAVLNMDRQLENLEAALERGRHKSEQIRALLDAALGHKTVSKKEKSNFHVLNKIRVDKGFEPIKDEPLIGAGDHDKLTYSYVDEDELPEEFRIGGKRDSGERMAESYIDEDDIPEEFRIGGAKKNANTGKITDTAKQQSMPGVSMNSNIQPLSNSGIRQGAITKKTIVVVDDDANDRQMCELFLSRRYNVVTLDSGMKAIDYFVRNKADLLLLDTYMPNLGGVQTLYSVRYQTYGSKVPVIYMIDKRYPVSAASLAGEYIAGIIQKPLTAGGLAIAIDGFFRRVGR